jgi:protoporphyrinogen oxidase
MSIKLPSFSRFTRRDFFKFVPLLILGLISVGLGMTKLFSPKLSQRFKGKIQGANAKIGHMMRMGKFPEPTSTQEVDTVIVGGGMAGLSAGWWLNKKDHKNFMILELDQNIGGNSQSGQNNVSAYPWAAHYVPLPGPETIYVRELFEELGIITGYQNGEPVYNEFYLCADPQERLYFQGKWNKGLFPDNGISQEDRRQFDEFFLFMKEMKSRKGKDGKWAVAIPLELSSTDEEIRKLDTISMSEFLKEKGWNSTYLKWYLDYCCRDDYGQPSEQVSAWAGIHYFAARKGKAYNASSDTVLTWPEGNGWIVKKIQNKFPEKIHKNALVHKVEKIQDFYLVTYFDVETKISKIIKSKNVIYAAPRFTAKYILHSSVGKLHDPKIDYVPWMVANVTVDRKPTGRGEDLAWDNVSYYSKSLGYIISTHQDLNTLKQETVLTYYLPLNDHSPLIERKLALSRDHAYWATLVSDDLENMHPGIEESIISIDVWVWGHGMVGPGINFLWSKEREGMLESLGRLHFAHTDMSGISIFEEAQYRGVMAARKVLEN